MKTLKSTLCAGLLASSLVVPAFANDTPVASPLPKFTVADTQMLFEQDAQPMQLAALSQQEMKETEGAWVAWVVRPAFSGGVAAGGAAWGSYASTGSVNWRAVGGAFVIGAFGGGGSKLLQRHNWW